MKQLLTLILLLCTTLLSARTRYTDTWQEVDTLLAQGYYTTAYEKSGQLLSKAKRKGDSHSMLKAVYKQQIAAAAYQEDYVAGTIKAYHSILPKLKGADKGMAYMLLANVYQDYLNRNRWKIRQNTTSDTPTDDISTWSQDMFDLTIRQCYEAAFAEDKSLKSTRAEDYDLLVEGDSVGLRLRPTLYDIVMHAVTDGIAATDDEVRGLLEAQRGQLFGTAEEFLVLALPDSTASHTLWQLKQLQSLTRYHLSTDDAALRAHIDCKRMEALKYHFTYSSSLSDSYVDGLERIAQSYAAAPAEEAMFVFLLARYHFPDISTYSSKEDMVQGVAKAAKMEQYLQRIKEIAPGSEWSKHGEQLYKRAVSPSLGLQDYITLLPDREGYIKLTLRNTQNIVYRIVPRHAGEDRFTMNIKEVLGRKSVGRPYYKMQAELSSPYVFEEINLPLPALEAGDYFVIATNDGKDEESKCSAITPISVSNLKMTRVIDHANDTHLGMVVDATTGRAVTDCEVSLMERTNKTTRLVERYFPDEKGYFVIPCPDRNTYRNLYLRASDGISYTTCPIVRDSWYTSASEVLFTFLLDRYTYAPGDAVHFNLMTYTHAEEGSRMLSQRPIKVSLRDTKNREVGSMQGVTDEWGCLSGVFEIDDAAMPGRFTLQTIDTLSGCRMYHTINVEAFKAPTFTATIIHPTVNVRFGDSLTLQGDAITFTDMPVSGAKVQYEITAIATSIFGYYPLYESGMHKVVGTTVSDEMGRFYIPFKVGESTHSEKKATGRYTIKAHVTDTNGETQTAQISLVVGYRTKHVVFDRASEFTLHGDSIGYTLRTLTDEPMAERVHVRLSKLSVPVSPSILASVENMMETWDEEITFIDRDEQTSVEGSNLIPITPSMPCGIYRLTVSYDDGDKQYSDTYHFTLWSEGKFNAASYCLYTMGSATREVVTGDTAVIYLGTRYSDVYLHYYVRVEGRVVDKGTLQLTDEVATLRVPIEKSWRGYMSIELAAVKENVSLASSITFDIIDHTEQLKVHLSTFRDYLKPGDTEQCTISVKDYLGRPVEAAVTLSVYNAAFDSYGYNNWDIALAPSKPSRRLEIAQEYLSSWAENPQYSMPSLAIPRYYRLPEVFEEEVFYSLAAPATTRGRAKNLAGIDRITVVETAASVTSETLDAQAVPSEGSESPSKIADAPLYLRKNLCHTALFLPSLHTDEQGCATFTLTAPDLLTRWHVKGIAHTKELKYGRIQNSFITRKTLMVQPHVPRFLYEGDSCNFAAKVTNCIDAPMSVVVRFETTSQSFIEQTISLAPNSNQTVEFPLVVSAGETSLTYRITAQSTAHSDGEQGSIPILPRRVLVTETMSLYLNGREQRKFTFDALKNHSSATLEHHCLKLDVVANPIWYVIEALPPLSQESNPSHEQLFHRYYAVAMGAKLVEQFPEVEGYIEFYNHDSLLTLQQNLLQRLSEAQLADGGWAWMEGFGSSQYVTQLILKGIGELEAMGCVAVAQDETLYPMIKQGMAYLDRTYQEDFNRLKHKPKALNSDALHYLYVRSMYPELPFGDGQYTAYQHYKTLLLKDKATRGSLMQKVLKMHALLRLNERSKALKVANVVSESSLESDEMGVYWRDNRYGYGWDSNPITTQALLIEAFVRLGQPAEMVARMQQWLLKQKQTTHWGNSISTAQAVHALVVSPNPPSERRLPYSAEGVKIKVGGKAVEALQASSVRDERLGIIKQQWEPDEIAPSLAKVTLEQQAEIPVWGSIIWQYYEEVDKVKTSGTGLTLNAVYYKVTHTDRGEVLVRIDEHTPLSVGDRIRVQLSFSADRVMDYVELHMHRPAALEPVVTRSGYTYSKGIAYYHSIENTKSAYYLQRIDKGRYTIESDFWVAQSGTYTCGLSTIQCMYAPSFAATAEASRLVTLR